MRLGTPSICLRVFVCFPLLALKGTHHYRNYVIFSFGLNQMEVPVLWDGSKGNRKESPASLEASNPLILFSWLALADIYLWVPKGQPSIEVWGRLGFLAV